MLKIRLQRVGRKHDPSFRVVLTDSHNGPKSGKFLEVLGSYDARSGKQTLNKERILSLIEKGAQTSDTLHNILVSEKVISGKKKNVLPRKTPIKKEGAEEEKNDSAPATEAEAPKTEDASATESEQKEEVKKEEKPVENPQ